MKIPCNMVQDLLPSYIDDICSEETTKQVEEHLGKCQNCEKKYREMKGELPEKLMQEPEEVLSEEFQPMKKIRKRHTWHVAILAATIVLVIIGGSIIASKKNANSYSAGYGEGTTEGYSTGYSEGYVDATAENPDLLTMKVETLNTGEILIELLYLMKEKWNHGEALYVVREKEATSCYFPMLHLCLSDGESAYIVEGFVGYKENTLTLEVKRVGLDAVEISEQCFRFEALVDCAKAMNISLNDDFGDRTVVFIFNANDELKSASKIGVHVEDENLENWIYRDGQVEKVLEDTQLEGYGAYYVVHVVSSGLVFDENEEPHTEMIEKHSLYIETK